MGTATIHKGDLCHAVAPVTEGVRYSLLIFFHDEVETFEQYQLRMSSAITAPSEALSHATHDDVHDVEPGTAAKKTKSTPYSFPCIFGVIVLASFVIFLLNVVLV